jgi:IS5 family transposase
MRSKFQVRARVEHVFGVVKRLCGFNKVRYGGLANIFLARRTLYGQVRP